MHVTVVFTSLASFCHSGTGREVELSSNLGSICDIAELVRVYMLFQHGLREFKSTSGDFSGSILNIL